MSSSPTSSELVLAIHGVGLLGGSIAAAVKQRRLAHRVIGIGRNAARLQAAVDQGLLDEYTIDPAASSCDWNFVVIATPVDRIAADAKLMAECSAPGTIITDVGSSKQNILRDLQNLFWKTGRCELAPQVEFVGSHPLAGSEKRGHEAARADLFDQRTTVVTPLPHNQDTAIARVIEFWQSLGSRVVTMDAAAHDEALATTSHVPHVVAAALAANLQVAQQPLAATGFRDTTRIAAGDPDLWVSILRSNAPAVLQSLHEFNTTLREFAFAIETNNTDVLRHLLQRGKTNRDALDS